MTLTASCIDAPLAVTAVTQCGLVNITISLLLQYVPCLACSITGHILNSCSDNMIQTYNVHKLSKQQVFNDLFVCHIL